MTVKTQEIYAIKSEAISYDDDNIRTGNAHFDISSFAVHVLLCSFIYIALKILTAQL